MTLAMFVACEKAIVDRIGNISVIVIMQSVNVAQSSNEPIPVNAVGPKEWVLAAIWLPNEQEVGKTYDQQFEIFLPDGTSFAKPTVQFTIPNTKPATNFVQLNAMPFGWVGNLLLKSWVEDQGVAITEVAEYPLEVTHIPFTGGAVQ